MTSADDVEKRIAEIEARTAKATAGPWTVFHKSVTLEVQNENRDPRKPVVHWTGFDAAFGPWVLKVANAKFIAHSRADVPWLIEQWRSLRRENEVLRAALKAEREECAKVAISLSVKRSNAAMDETDSLKVTALQFMAVGALDAAAAIRARTESA